MGVVFVRFVANTGDAVCTVARGTLMDNDEAILDARANLAALVDAAVLFFVEVRDVPLDTGASSSSSAGNSNAALLYCL
jgi:hypothetical protein